MKRILVQRLGALGDVFDVTAILKRLRDENPDAEIDVSTHHTNVLAGSSFHDNIIQNRRIEYDHIINLDGAYEKPGYRGLVHIIDAYSEVAFGDRKTPRKIYYNHGDPPSLGLEWDRVICFHPGRSWPQRTLPENFWRTVALAILSRGFVPLAIGTSQDHSITGPGIFSTIGRLTLAEQIAVIGASKSFICSVSGPSCFAYTTETPMVVLCTMSTKETHLHERDAVTRFIDAPIECVGCEAKAPGNVNFFPCLRGDNICTTLFDPFDVVEEAINAAIAS